MARLRTKFKPKQQIGWWTLQSVIAEQPSAYRCGDRWSVKCRCGTIGSVTHEALQTGRSRSCDDCAKRYRAQHNDAAQLAELGALIIGDEWTTLYKRSPHGAISACERRLSAERAQCETFAKIVRGIKK
jgi:hypothetical protein